MSSSPRSGEQTSTWGTGASRKAASCQPIPSPAGHVLDGHVHAGPGCPPNQTSVPGAFSRFCLPTPRTWGSVGASPPGLLPNERNERNSAISRPQGQPPCDSVFIPLPGKPRCARGNCLPVAVACTLSALFANLLLRAAFLEQTKSTVWAGGSRPRPWPHHRVVSPYDSMLPSTHLACPTCQTWKQLCPSRPAASHGGGFSCPVPSPERAHWPLPGSGAPSSCRASTCLAR